jgi:hypothetical protein
LNLCKISLANPDDYPWGKKRKMREQEILSKCLLEEALEKQRNAMKYRNTHKHRDAAEIRLHFINNK